MRIVCTKVSFLLSRTVYPHLLLYWTPFLSVIISWPCVATLCVLHMQTVKYLRDFYFIFLGAITSNVKRCASCFNLKRPFQCYMYCCSSRKNKIGTQCKYRRSNIIKSHYIVTGDFIVWHKKKNRFAMVGPYDISFKRLRYSLI